MPEAIDPILAELTAPGQPFAVAERSGLRQFVNMPADLNALIDSARRHGDKTFLVEGERRLTFEQVFAWRDSLVPLLAVHRGERVAICMRNRAEWIIAFMAVVKAGAIAVLMNSRGSPAELAAMIDEVTPALVIADSERAAQIRAGGWAGRLFDLTDPPDPLPVADPAAPPPAQVSPDDPAVILFTSGTTGRVKGAVLSHRNIATGLLSMQLSGVMVLHNVARDYGMEPEALMAQMPQQAVLLVYPLFHISGLGSAFLSPLFAGSKVVIMRRWDAEEALRVIRDERITMFTGVPTMLWDLLHKARLGDADLSSLTNIASGGQALPVNLLDAVHAACPRAMMGTGYGMTECSGAIAQAVGADFLRKRASAGRVLPLVDVRIEGPDGVVLPAGAVGEIVVRGAQIMQGYWNRPEDTAAVLAPDGWLKTGDVGLIDEEGYVFIVDRTKDMVISGGENIYPAEVENALLAHPAVAECAVLGLPDAQWGEVLAAAVVLREGASLDLEALREFLARGIARFKLPRSLHCVQALPKTALGKVRKDALRELLLNS